MNEFSEEPPFKEVVLEIDSTRSGAELANEIYELLKAEYSIEGISGR